jgi:pilus assembly protein CpaF
MMNKLEMPLLAIRSQIANAIQIIVQANRLNDGTRRITQISKLAGLDENGNYLLNDLFTLEIVSTDANGMSKVQFVPAGILPSFFDEAERAGVKLPASLFEKSNS